jgi:hypothetical protein
LTSTRKHYPVISIGLLLLSLASFGFSHKEAARLRPLTSFDSPLNEGETISPTFKAKLEARYEIILRINRNAGIDDDKIRCLLGEKPDSQQSCTPISLEWDLLTDNKIMTSGTMGDTQIEFRATTMDKPLAEVALSPSAEYQLRLRLSHDGAIPITAKPRVVVRLSPFESKGRGIVSSLYLLASIAVGLLGLVGIGRFLYRRKNKK